MQSQENTGMAASLSKGAVPLRSGPPVKSLPGSLGTCLRGGGLRSEETEMSKMAKPGPGCVASTLGAGLGEAVSPTPDADLRKRLA